MALMEFALLWFLLLKENPKNTIQLSVATTAGETIEAAKTIDKKLDYLSTFQPVEE